MRQGWNDVGKEEEGSENLADVSSTLDKRL